MVGSGHNCRQYRQAYNQISSRWKRCTSVFFFSVGTKSSTGSSKNAACQLIIIIIIIIIIINILFILQKTGQLSMKKQLVQWYHGIMTGQ